jgi:hypothetical protein
VRVAAPVKSFRSPDGSALLQIDQTSTSKASAIQNWRDQEPDISQARPGYHLIKFAPAADQPPVHDESGNTAVDWEYTYSTPTGTPSSKGSLRRSPPFNPSSREAEGTAEREDIRCGATI